MANHREANVVFVDTDAVFADVKMVKSIKYIGNTSGTAVIKGGGSASGDTIWQEEGDANVYNPEVCLRDSSGIHVAVTNGATLFLYLP